MLLWVPYVIRYGFFYASREHADFPSFYFCAVLAFQEGVSPYGDAIVRFGQQIGYPVKAFVQPPPSLLMYHPLSLVSYETAKIVLLVINHLAVLFIIYFLSFKLLRRRGGAEGVFAFFILFILVFWPIIATLGLGQFSLLVLIGLCFTWYGLRRQWHAWRIALPLAFTILLKVYPVIFLVLLFVKKQYRVLIWTAALLVVAVAASVVVVPGAAWSDWFKELLPTGAYGSTPLGLHSPANPWNQSINGFTSRLFLENEFQRALMSSALFGRLVTYILSLLVLAITIFLSRRATERHENDELDLEFSAYLLAITLIAPVTWEHHLVFALPAALAAVTTIGVQWRDAKITTVLVWLAAFIIAWQFKYSAEWLRDWPAAFLISAKFYAIAGLWVIVAQALRKRASVA